MNKTVIALAGTLAFSALPTLVHAEDSPLSFNVGVFSDYRYRGISQTRLKPAVQAGVDYAIPGGFYVGAWISNIKWIKDFGGGANVEIDLYGGYKGEIAKDVAYDVGVLQYVYPSAKNAKWDASFKDPNTTEIYGALSFGPVTVKYSHAVSTLFGTFNSKNSDFSYTDYSLTVSKDFTVAGPKLSAP